MSTFIAAIAIAACRRLWFNPLVTKLKDRARLVKRLSELEAALGDNIERSTEIQRRVVAFHAAIDNGAEVTALVEDEEQPRTVEMLSENLAILEDVGSSFRQSLAQALRSEGMTIHTIGQLFGVTRQRISALLKQGQ